MRQDDLDMVIPAATEEETKASPQSKHFVLSEHEFCRFLEHDRKRLVSALIKKGMKHDAGRA